MQNVLQFLQASIAVEHRRRPEDGVLKLVDPAPPAAAAKPAPSAAAQDADAPAEEPGPWHPFPVHGAA
ncbi:hypothetical protein [Mangrovicoccus sp. HB161399]|uniref:hypothetical protein n=1 Tax=Mangrovicoccus sp. HB161399 TaxID=2720392 RepID=UPI0015525FA9|nr:hypothetical protein [Mangrovicoccus sp. HB161399]